MIRQPTGARIQYQGGAPDYNGTYALIWAWKTQNTPSGDILAINGSNVGGTNNDVDAVYITDVAGTKYPTIARKVGGTYQINNVADGGSGFSAFPLVSNTMYYFCVLAFSGQLILLAGTSPDNMDIVAGGVFDPTGRTAAAGIYFGGWDSSSTAVIDHDWTNIKVFDAATGGVPGNTPRIRNEMAKFTTDLAPAWALWSAILAPDLADRSGNSRTLVVGTGSLTSQHQPAALYNNLWLTSLTTAPPISPTPTTGWDDTEDLVRKWGSLLKGSSALTSLSCDEAVTTNNLDSIAVQYLWGPAQRDFTLDGYILGVMRALESSVNANAQAQMAFRVVTPAGATRGSVARDLDASGTGNEFNTSLRSILWPRNAGQGVALTSVSGLAGDWLCLELGARFVNTSATNFSASLNVGDTPATLLDLTESDTGADCPTFLLSCPIADIFTPYSTPYVLGYQANFRAAYH